MLEYWYRTWTILSELTHFFMSRQKTPLYVSIFSWNGASHQLWKDVSFWFRERYSWPPPTQAQHVLQGVSFLTQCKTGCSKLRAFCRNSSEGSTLHPQASVNHFVNLNYNVHQCFYFTEWWEFSDIPKCVLATSIRSQIWLNTCQVQGRRYSLWIS